MDLWTRPRNEEIPFRIHPNERLLIAKTTYSPHVLKIKSVVNDLTGMTIEICGDLTHRHSEADERISAFINEFKPAGEEVGDELQ